MLLRKDLKPGKISLSSPPNGQTRLQALGSGFVTLDLGGLTLFILGVGLVILGTAWGGATYPWSSGAVISTLVIGAVLIVLFLVYEALLAPSRMLNRAFPRTVPMIPSTILKSKDVSLVCLIAAGTGAAIYSVFYFIGIYFTLVEGYEASHAGTQLLYYVPGLGVGVYIAIFVCNVWPRQTFYPLFLGTVVETAGMAVLAYAVKVRNPTLVNVMMGISGAGTGVRFMPSNLHMAGMFRDKLASAYSLLRFAMPFGGTLALTIMGSVFQNQMSEYFSSGSVAGSSSGGAGFDVHRQSSLDGISDLPPAERDAIRAQGATATMWAFISIIPILGLSMFASGLLGNVWISKKKSKENANADAAEKGTGTSANETPDTAPAREDGTCFRHARDPSSPGDELTTPPHANEVEYMSEIFVLACMRGDVARLKRAGAREDGRTTTAATSSSTHPTAIATADSSRSPLMKNPSRAGYLQRQFDQARHKDVQPLPSESSAVSSPSREKGEQVTLSK